MKRIFVLAAAFAAFSSAASAQTVDPIYTYPGAFGGWGSGSLPVYVPSGADNSPTGSASVVGGTYVLEDAKGNLADPAKIKPLSDGSAPAGYQWVQANYSTLAQAENVTPFVTADGKYIVDHSGHVLDTATATADGFSASTTSAQALGSSKVDPKALAVDPTSGVPASFANQIIGSPLAVAYSGITGISLSNTVTTTGIGTNGVTVADKGGNKTTIGSDKITVAGPNGSVTIADPSVVVTNGTAAGTTSIVNGSVTAGSSVSAPTVNATTVNATTVNATAVSAGYVGANVLATQDSAGLAYGNVGDTLTSHQSQINTLSTYTHDQVKKLSGGIATATAFESPQVDPGKHFGVALNWGEFNGYSGFAASGKFRFTDTWAATAGIGVDQNSNVSAKAGIQAQW